MPGLAHRRPPAPRPGYGAAWWNAGARPVAGQRPLPGGRQPAAAVPFPRLRARPPARAHEYQDRVRLGDDRCSRQLCDDYATSAPRGAAHEEASTWPYRYTQLLYGHAARRPPACALRQGRARGRADGLAVRRAPACASSTLVQQPATPRRRVRAQPLPGAHLHGAPGPAHGLPNLDDPDGDGFRGWVDVHAGKARSRCRRAAAAQPRAAGGSPSASAPTRSGCERRGLPPLRTGLGEAARQLIGGLDAAHVPALPVRASCSRHSRQEAEFAIAGPDRRAVPDQHRLHERGHCPGVRARGRRAVLRGPAHDRAVVVGAERFPRGMARGFEHVDEIWAARRFIADALAPTAPVPVIRVPLPVIAAEGVPHGRDALRHARGLRLPVRVRLPQRGRAQEPGGR